MMAETNQAGSHSGFFYGTLMAPRVLSRVCFGPDLPGSTTSRLSSLQFIPAILPGYRRHRVKGVDYPGIVENADAEVRGTLVTGLTDGDMWRLDTFEGDEYVRRKVKVYTLDDEASRGSSTQANGMLPPAAESSKSQELVETEVYVWIVGVDGLEEAEWDFDEFVKAKMWRWVGDGAEQQGEYSEVDRAVAQDARQSSGISAVEDPTGGRGMNGSITKALTDNIR